MMKYDIIHKATFNVLKCCRFTKYMHRIYVVYVTDNTYYIVSSSIWNQTSDGKIRYFAFGACGRWFKSSPRNIGYAVAQSG